MVSFTTEVLKFFPAHALPWVVVSYCAITILILLLLLMCVQRKREPNDPRHTRGTGLDTVDNVAFSEPPFDSAVSSRESDTKEDSPDYENIPRLTKTPEPSTLPCVRQKYVSPAQHEKTFLEHQYENIGEASASLAAAKALSDVEQGIQTTAENKLAHKYRDLTVQSALIQSSQEDLIHDYQNIGNASRNIHRFASESLPTGATCRATTYDHLVPQVPAHGRRKSKEDVKFTASRAKTSRQADSTPPTSRCKEDDTPRLPNSMPTDFYEGTRDGVNTRSRSRSQGELQHTHVIQLVSGSQFEECKSSFRGLQECGWTKEKEKEEEDSDGGFPDYYNYFVFKS